MEHVSTLEDGDYFRTILCQSSSGVISEQIPDLRHPRLYASLGITTLIENDVIIKVSQGVYGVRSSSISSNRNDRKEQFLEMIRISDVLRSRRKSKKTKTKKLGSICLNLQSHQGSVHLVIEERNGCWWALKGSKIRSSWSSSFLRGVNGACIPQIEKRLEMHEMGIVILSDDGASFVLQEDFEVAPKTCDETMNLSPVATWANAAPSHGRGFKVCEGL